MYIYSMERETRKRFKTMFHVEQKTENMALYMWEEKQQEIAQQIQKIHSAMTILCKFIQSLNNQNNDTTNSDSRAVSMDGR